MISRMPSAMVAGVGVAPAICSMVIAMFSLELRYGCVSLGRINAQGDRILQGPRPHDTARSVTIVSWSSLATMLTITPRRAHAVDADRAPLVAISQRSPPAMNALTKSALHASDRIEYEISSCPIVQFLVDDIASARQNADTMDAPASFWSTRWHDGPTSTSRTCRWRSAATTPTCNSI